MNAKRANGASDPTEAEIRYILVNVARVKGLITYSELVKRVKNYKMNPNIVTLANKLTSISKREHALGRGLLSAVVIRKKMPEQGIPGSGFFNRLAPFLKCRGQTKRVCWQRHLDQVYNAWNRRRC